MSKINKTKKLNHFFWGFLSNRSKIHFLINLKGFLSNETMYLMIFFL